MPKARKRKDTQFDNKMSKCVFLYGEPTKDKADKIKKMQDEFAKLINLYISQIYNNNNFTLQIVKDDKRDSQITAFEKSIRPDKINAAYSQTAFKLAITHLSNRLDNIRLDMCRECKSIFTTSKVLFAMSIDGRSKAEMITAMQDISKSIKSKKDTAFYDECAEELKSIKDSEFKFMQQEFRVIYDTISCEYSIPYVSRSQIPLDSRIMTIKPSRNIKTPYVITISNMTDVGGEKIEVPLNTSKHSIHKINTRKMAGMVSISMDIQRCLKVDWSYKNCMSQPKTSKIIGVDTGISDAFHTSEDKAIGSMSPVINFYKDDVEKSFASLSNMRNKKRKISHYLRRHENLPEDARRSLIQKMDKLDQMIQKAEAPHRKNRRYYNMLEHEIKSSIDSYIKSIDNETLTVLEKLDINVERGIPRSESGNEQERRVIKEFNNSRKANGKRSMFARGQLQKKLMETLNWKGYDFKEIEPDYTSQCCPVCSYTDKANRNGKSFKCQCCGYEADADYVGALNIKARAEDKEILDVCEKYKYNHDEMQKHIKMVYHARNEKYKAAGEAMQQNDGSGSRDAA
ncbi:zinc ribbon domain-containing protein [Ruminococcus sp. RTP21484sp1_RTP31023st1_H8_RTP31023_210422]|uniref:zinc ribbon domain-containing protein n=1 Tax=Ruminococcus sp. RTP21484sp1_RTP31023st1_H8_RTP31023_210422 TaxID=3141611 RepID=UPI0034A27BF7